MIKGDIDLTTNLDFRRDEPYRNRNKKYNGKSLPWKRSKKESSYSLATLDNSYYLTRNDPWNYSTTTYGTMSTRWTTIRTNDSVPTVTYINDNIVAYQEDNHLTLNITVNDNALTRTSTFSTNDELGYDSFNWHTISSRTYRYDLALEDGVSYIVDSDSDSTMMNIRAFGNGTDEEYTIIPDDDYIWKIREKPFPSEIIFGPKKSKENKETTLHYNWCCGTKTIGKCKCDRKQNPTSKILDLFRRSRKRKEVIKVEEMEDNHYNAVETIKNTEYKRRRRGHTLSPDRLLFHSFLYNSKIKIPWLQKLNSRRYDDYMEELRSGNDRMDEKDYNKYLLDTTWVH